MKDRPTWSDADRAAIAVLEAEWSENAHHTITVDRLLTNWERLVDEVGHGYDDVIEEYQNDLDSRLLLQEALDKLAPGVTQQLLPWVETLDARFVEATVQIDPPPWSGGWWARRVPTNPSTTLASDLASEIGSYEIVE